MVRAVELLHIQNASFSCSRAFSSVYHEKGTGDGLFAWPICWGVARALSSSSQREEEEKLDETRRDETR